MRRYCVACSSSFLHVLVWRTGWFHWLCFYFWDRAPAVFQIPQAYRLVGAAFCFLEPAARFERCAAYGSGRIKESEGGVQSVLWTGILCVFCNGIHEGRELLLGISSRLILNVLAGHVSRLMLIPLGLR
ncbi:hypothetical protein CI102_5083 [Trichoderma harzianum]|nr:hypothetical protein CI102_5083 [Trichoderma harzianum]